MIAWGFGVDAVAHLDQPRELGATPETAIHAGFTSRWISISPIVFFELAEPSAQSCGLVAQLL